MRRPERLYLQDILESCDAIQLLNRTDEMAFMQDELIQSAILQKLGASMSCQAAVRRPARRSSVGLKARRALPRPRWCVRMRSGSRPPPHPRLHEALQLHDRQDKVEMTSASGARLIPASG